VAGSRPVTNVYGDEPWELEAEHMGVRGRGVAKPAGARELGATVYELAPGASGFHLHAHYGIEELFVVLEGTPTLRTSESEHKLERGDVVVCRRGRDGTHTFANRSVEPVRLLAVSTLNFPDVVLYPEQKRAFVMTRQPFEDVEPGADEGLVKVFDLGDA
jgi:uncharacterized cupin superfamily protein